MNISTYRNTSKLKFRASKITFQISFNKLQSVQGKKLYDKLGSGNYYRKNLLNSNVRNYIYH